MTSQSSTPDLELGTRVTFSRKLHRFRKDNGVRVWEAPDWLANLPAEGGTGVVAGVRYLQNGRQEYATYNPQTYGMDGEDRWIIEEVIKTYLIAHDIRKKPVYVLPEHLKAI